MQDICAITDTGLYTGYDANGNAIENTFILGFYNQYNQNPSLTVPEYAEGWLENFVKTGDPNGVDADGEPMPEWKTYSEEEKNVIRFKTK